MMMVPVPWLRTASGSGPSSCAAPPLAHQRPAASGSGGKAVQAPSAGATEPCVRRPPGERETRTDWFQLQLEAQTLPFRAMMPPLLLLDYVSVINQLFISVCQREIISSGDVRTD